MLQEILELHKQGKLAEAESRYRELLTFNPDDPETLHLLGVLRRQQGDLREAQQLLRRAIELSPDRPNYYLSLAGMELHARQLEAARADFETALRLNPNLTGAYSALGQIALLQGDGARAEENFKRALASGDERSDVLTGYGTLLLQRGAHDEALRYYTRAAEKYPTDPVAQAGVGRAYAAKGMHAFARQALENAVKLRPDYHPARLALAEVMIAQRDLGGADAELRVLLRDTTQFAPVNALLGDTARARGELGRAASHYKESLKSAPQQPRVVAALAWCLMQLRLHREAIGAWREYLRHRPEDVEAQRSLGLTAAEAGLYDEARAALASVVAARPGDRAARVQLAAVLEASGDLEGSEHEADRALALGADAGAALLKARAELRRGDHAAAAARLDAIDSGGLGAAQARFRHALRGHAHDLAGDAPAAVASWLAAHQAGSSAMPPAVDAVPPGFEQAVADARAAEPMRVERAPAALLLGAPGGGAELIATLLRDEPGIALLSERFGPQARSDAFSAIEGRYASPTDSEARVQARRYERALAHLKVPPGRAPIDWLPHWDLRLLPLALQILGDVPLIVAARDLRDALLQWLAHGSAQGWRIADAEAAAEWLARSAAQLEWTVAHAGVPVLVVDPTEALADPAGTRARLLAFLGQAPSTQPVAMLGRGVGGLPNLFERGHHAQYAQALVGAFARLDAATRGT
ncbi:MAG: tetratricopeptide repeat protein [Xanthomonadales bacterium]|nr:tetratricopeptide repeat protein [Xanthomonadales bacterium]